MAVTEAIDKAWGWHRLPLPLALAVLEGIRMRMRQQNLYDPATPAYYREMKPAVPEDDRYLARRTADGTFNKPTYTKEGIDWIADNGFASVLLRHFPVLAPRSTNARIPSLPGTSRSNRGRTSVNPALESRPGGRRVPPYSLVPRAGSPPLTT